MENIRAKAYKEVYEILKKVSKKDLEKIPKEVLIMLQTNMDKDYKYQVLEDVDFEKQQMLRETKILLAIIYRDFWATEYERDRINKKVNYDVQKYEEDKKQKYSSNDIFVNVKKKQESVQEKTDLPIVIQKQNFFVKLINYIKKKFFNNVQDKDVER